MFTCYYFLLPFAAVFSVKHTVEAFPSAAVIKSHQQQWCSSGCVISKRETAKRNYFIFPSSARSSLGNPHVQQLQTLFDDNNNNGGGGGGRGGFGGSNSNNNGDDGDENNFWLTLSSASAVGVLKDDDNQQVKNVTLSKEILDKLNNAVSEIAYFVRHSILRQPTEEERTYQRLRNTVISCVTCNSSILPDSVVQLCAKRGRLIGSPLLAETVQETARFINQWYKREGYALSSMTGATLIEEETGKVELVVEEPRFSDPCVAIAYAKPIINNGTSSSDRNTNNNTITFEISTTDGKTNPTVIQKALGFVPGAPFQWKEREWREMSSSNNAVFSSILHAEPHRLDDGSVQFRIIAQERKAGNFAYGVSKSLMKVQDEQSSNPASSLEGELSFDYGNVFGGGETVSFSVRRAAKDPEASYRFSYRDEEFCTSANGKHGWSIEGFNQYIGKGDNLILRQQTIQKHPKPNGSASGESIAKAVVEGTAAAAAAPDEMSSLNLDSQVIRKGASFMIKNPLASFGIQRSATEFSAERLVSTSGKSENVVSGIIGLGPFVSYLPRDGRHSVQFALGLGSRIGGVLWGKPISPPDAFDTSNSLGSSVKIPFQVSGSIPFSHASATVREVFPLTTSSSFASDRSISLALRHTVSACTDTIPLTKAIANAAAHKVRGYGSSSRRPSADESQESIFQGYRTMVMGTTEIRIPVTLPTDRFLQDASVVVFGDWLYAKELNDSGNINKWYLPSLTRKSSVGIGIRKSVQGFPLQYDISLTEDGKIGAFLNFGRDFDVY